MKRETIPWYQNKLRRTLLDMHIPDWNDEFMRSFDPETYFKALKTANVNAPMIYVQAHTGLCYWPTKVGTMHKGFVGCEDKMKHLFDLCNADGMSTILYYSLIYNTEEYFKHPQWQMRDVEGRGCTFKGSRYGLCCPNNMEYRAFVAAQICRISSTILPVTVCSLICRFGRWSATAIPAGPVGRKKLAERCRLSWIGTTRAGEPSMRS